MAVREDDTFLKGVTAPARIRTWLLLFTVVQALPFIAIVWIDAIHRHRTERAAFRAHVRDMTEGIADGFDHSLAAYIERLKTLATSPALAIRPDLKCTELKVAYEQVKAATEPDGLIVFLQTLDGKQLFNTRVPLCRPLPPRLIHIPAADLAQGHFVSDMVRSPSTDQFIIEISVPVPSPDHPQGALSLSIPVSALERHLDRILSELREKHAKTDGVTLERELLQSEWGATIVDRQKAAAQMWGLGLTNRINSKSIGA